MWIAKPASGVSKIKKTVVDGLKDAKLWEDF